MAPLGRDSPVTARAYRVEGRVQGVGFRMFVRQAARDLGISGWVRNLPDGAVEAFGQGQAGELERFEKLLGQGPPLARVDALVADQRDTTDAASFRILP